MLNIGIATPALDIYSETFIRAHIERLPGKVVALYGGVPPTLIGNDNAILPLFTLRNHLHWTVLRLLRNYEWLDWCNKHLANALRQYEIDVLLAEYGTVGVAMIDACRLAHIPLVVCFRGFDIYKQDYLEGVGKRYPELLQEATAIIAVSKAIERRLIEIGAAPDKVHYIPSGVDVQLFNNAALRFSPPTFLAVGRFVDKKAPELTLLAFQKVVEQIPDARLVMVGSGPLREICQRLTKQWQLDQSVSFPGQQSHQEIVHYMQQACVFVQHSIESLSGDSEGTPNTLKEAQASGLPVIATYHGGIPDIVLDGETGFLVEEGDVEGMATAMVQLVSNPQLATQMGQAGRQRMKDYFSMEQSIRKLWLILEAAIEKKKHANC